MKFVAIFTLGAVGFMGAVAFSSWREVFTSTDPLGAFGLAWLASFAAFFFAALSYALLRYAPWGIPNL